MVRKRGRLEILALVGVSSVGDKRKVRVVTHPRLISRLTLLPLELTKSNTFTELPLTNELPLASLESRRQARTRE